MDSCFTDIDCYHNKVLYFEELVWFFEAETVMTWSPIVVLTENIPQVLIVLSVIVYLWKDDELIGTVVELHEAMKDVRTKQRCSRSGLRGTTGVHLPLAWVEPQYLKNK